MADGENVRDIARATGLTEGAIYWHLKQIYRKLPISRQVDLTTMSPTLVYKWSSGAGKTEIPDKGKVLMNRLGWIFVGVFIFVTVAPSVAQEEPFKLLATNRTGTLESELNELPPGFSFVGMTVFNSRFGGDETASILEAVITE